MHFQSQLNAPPEFPIGSKYLAVGRTYIFLRPKLQNPYPQSVLGTGETVRSSMPQGTLLYPAYICPEPPARRDCPLIHAPWNIVITLHIIGHPRSPLHPYAMGHCQPPQFHALWKIRAIQADLAGLPHHGSPLKFPIHPRAPILLPPEIWPRPYIPC